MIRHLGISSVAGLIGATMLAGASAAVAKEPVSVAIISFSPYAAWYIVKEKNLAPEIDLTVSIIEGITEKNAAITSGQVQCMNNTLDSMVAGRSGDLPIKVVAFSNMSYGLDKMIVAEGINAVEDVQGQGVRRRLWLPQPHVGCSSRSNARGSTPRKCGTSFCCRRRARQPSAAEVSTST